MDSIENQTNLFLLYGCNVSFFPTVENERILDIVLKIFHKGFDSLSGNAFTRSVGISRGIFYLGNRKFYLVYVFLPQHQQVVLLGYPGLVLDEREY